MSSVSVTGKKQAAVNEIYEWISAIVVSLVTVVLIFTFIFRIVGVEGISMKNTLNRGVESEKQTQDRVIITNLNYTPKQKDIVVIKTTILTEPIIKRVIAVAGQTVNIDFVKHIVYVNGKALQESYIKEPTTRRGDVTFPVKVPSGCVFVMGDNRNESYDSRYSAVGMINTNDILGRAIFRIYPFDRLGKIG